MQQLTNNPTVTPATASLIGPVAPAPVVQAPAPATVPAAPTAPATPKTGKGATLTGITNPKQPVTAAMVHAFVNRAAGGNYANVQVVFTGSKAGANPMPFANMAKAGKRAQILWAIVNGVPASTKGGSASKTLASYLTYSVARGASKSAMLDLLAALNGGFSTSSKNWGTPYAKLVVTA